MRSRPGARWLVALALLLAIPFPGLPRVSAATNEAGLVIRHADGSLTFAWVPFSEPELSGIALLERTGLQVDQVAFGGLGQAICGIEHRGCAPAACSERLCQGPRPDDPYWRYFRLDAEGTWQPFVLGASSAKVRPGDIHGWSWTGGDPQLPRVTMAEIRDRTGGGSGSAAVHSGLLPDVNTGLTATTAAAGIMLLAGVAAASAVTARSRKRRDV